MSILITVANLHFQPIYIFNLVDITKLPCYTHRRSTTVSLETFTLYFLLQAVIPSYGSSYNLPVLNIPES